MKNEKISQIISGIDAKYTDEASAFDADIGCGRTAPDKQTVKRRRFKPRAIAACVALFIVAGSASLAIAAEAKEYNTAIAFFEENGLSSEGLSRSEVKEVYRDITTERFTYGKTAEVIRHAVSGMEIQQDEPTPEELSALWSKSVRMKAAAVQTGSVSHDGISFNKYSVVDNDDNGNEIFKKCVLECFKDGKLLWSADFTDFFVESYSHTKDGTVVWGSDCDAHPSASERHYLIAHVDDNGNVTWQQLFSHGLDDEYVVSVLSNGDGTWAQGQRFRNADGNRERGLGHAAEVAAQTAEKRPVDCFQHVSVAQFAPRRFVVARGLHDFNGRFFLRLLREDAGDVDIRQCAFAPVVASRIAEFAELSPVPARSRQFLLTLSSVPSSTMPKPPLITSPQPTPPPLWMLTHVAPRNESPMTFCTAISAQNCEPS